MDSRIKVQQVTEKLETAFGIPRWQGQGNPLDSLVLTILSQSTNDRNRDAAYRQLVKQFPDWEMVMNAPAEQIAQAIRTAGLSNQKSVNIQEALRWIYSTWHSFDLSFICDMEPQQVIDTFMQLKGVGIKTISVVLMVACGVDIFPVDTHVHRICKRLALVPEKAGAEKTHHLMQPLVPKGKAWSLHMNFLKLGRTICKAQKPACDKCPLCELCPSARLE